MSEEKKNEVLNQDKAVSEQELSDVTGGGFCLCAVAGGGPPAGARRPAPAWRAAAVFTTK